MRNLSLYTVFVCILAVTLALPASISASTEFVSTIQESGGDYTGLIPWEAAMASTTIDLTAATTKVFAHGGITGSIADDTEVTGVMSAATGTAVHTTATQILIKNITGTFQSGEQVQVDGSNHVTISDAGDSASVVAKIDGTWTSEESGFVFFQSSEWTTGASNYIRIYTTPTARHGGVWSTTKYRIKNPSFQDVIENEVPYTRVEGLQIEHSNDNSKGFSSNGCGSSISHSIVRFLGTPSGDQSRGINLSCVGAGNTAWNNIVYGFRRGINANYGGSSGPIHAYNNTVFGSEQYGVVISGFAGAEDYVFKNNISVDSGISDYHTENIAAFAASSTNNLSSDATSPNATYRSLDPTFVSTSTPDYHLAQTDTAARDEGADLSADSGLSFTDDIDGDTRPQGSVWDIGADEMVDTTPPSVSVTAPADASTVSGSTVTVSANASDNVGVSGVQFILDGSDLGAEDTSSPYSITWDSTTASDGAHTLAARARDAAGNTATSTNINVTVDNTGPVRSNGAPTDALSAGTIQATLSLTTNENATCKYDTTAGTLYAAMATTFTTTGGTSHSTIVTGLTNGSTNTYYVRCEDGGGTSNTSDFTITFTIDTPPAGSTSFSIFRQFPTTLHPGSLTPEERAVRIAAIRTQLITLIGQVLVLLEERVTQLQS